MKMKTPDIIELYSRYSDVHNWLSKVDDNKYKLNSTVGTIRCIESPESQSYMDAIDPSGGPILGVGDCLGKNGEFIINKIYHSKEHRGYIIEVIDNPNDKRD